jgi:hypothetical protein
VRETSGFDMDAVKDVVHGLIGGMSPEDFNDRVRERQLAHFKAALAPSLLDGIFDMTRLERLLRADDRATPYIDIFDGTQLRQFVDRDRQPGHTNFDVVAASLRGGATIRVRSAEAFDAELGELTKALERHFVGRCSGNVYLTPPREAGFPPHFDLTDVFVIQCAGKKHWRIYDRYANMTELPLADARWEADRFQPVSPPRDFELNRGDVLYLPRGVMHEAFCTDRESMHLTISLASLSYADLLRQALAAAAAGDIELRRRVPWPAADTPAAAQRLAQQARDLFAQVAADIEFAALLRQARPGPLPAAGVASSDRSA